MRDAYDPTEVILVVKNLNGKITTSYFKLRKMRKLNKNALKFCLRDKGSLQYRLISIEMGRAATVWSIFKIELTNFVECLDVETIGNRKKKDNSIENDENDNLYFFFFLRETGIEHIKEDR